MVKLNEIAKNLGVPKGKIKDMILEVYANYSQHLPTRQLNEVIRQATIRHQIPSDHSKIVKIYFIRRKIWEKI